MFYVYEHWRPDTNTCFYVGKGKGRRAYDMKNRNKLYLAILEELNQLNLILDCRFCAINMSEDAAFALEIQRIAYWRSKGVVLVNRTDGGPTPPSQAGIPKSAEHKAKIGAGNKGKRRSPEFCAHMREVGKQFVFTDEHCKKIAVANTGNQNALGYKHSTESSAKMKAAWIKRKARKLLESSTVAGD